MDYQARQSEVDSFFVQVTNNPAPDALKRCTKCIASEAFTELVDGVCTWCRETAPAEVSTCTEIQTLPKLSEELHTTLQNLCGSGQYGYDVLALYSGGKDSAYLLLRLSREYPKLRILALMVDNGFMSPQVARNYKATFQQLDIDSMVLRPKRSLFETAFRTALKKQSTESDYAVVDRIDGDLTFDICRNYAALHGIPAIISGLSRPQIEGILHQSSFETPGFLDALDRTDSAEIPVEKISGETPFLWWNPRNHPATRIPREIHPFMAWEYDEAAIRHEVQEHGLLSPGATDPLSTNNDLIPIILARDIHRFGFSGYEPEFARLVRLGAAERTTWQHFFSTLRHEVLQGTFMPETIKTTLQRLGFSAAELGLTAYRF